MIALYTQRKPQSLYEGAQVGESDIRIASGPKHRIQRFFMRGHLDYAPVRLHRRRFNFGGD